MHLSKCTKIIYRGHNNTANILSSPLNSREFHKHFRQSISKLISPNANLPHSKSGQHECISQINIIQALDSG